MLKISKILLILILPFMLFLLIVDFTAFDHSFYTQKFAEYGVGKIVPNAEPLHAKVISFIKGYSDQLPTDFGVREKSHLWDVRTAISVFTILLYILIIIFVFLLMISAFTLKVNSYVTNFIGKVLFFGGFLAIIIAAILFFLLSSNFPSTFESFHTLLFQKGTYTFDPRKEILVDLYPEQLFMDLGIKISEWTVIVAALLALLGLLLIFRSKKQK